MNTRCVIQIYLKDEYFFCYDINGMAVFTNDINKACLFSSYENEVAQEYYRDLQSDGFDVVFLVV